MDNNSESVEKTHPCSICNKMFRNYGADGDDVNKLFCTLPRSEWGQYFTSRV